MPDSLASRMRRLPRRLAKSVLRHTWYRDALYKPHREDLPFLVRLDINNTCNLRCPNCFYPAFCKSGTQAHHMSPDEFRVICDRLLDYAYALQFACSFEPLMHPEFPEIARILDTRNIPTTGMVTNGVLLEGERAEALHSCSTIKEISVSINAFDPAVYERMHGRAMGERVRGNLEAFVRARATDKEPRVKINAVLTRTNLQELPKLLVWAAEIGCDEVQFFHVDPWGKENPESLAGDPEAYNRVWDELNLLKEQHDLFVFLPPPMRPEYKDPETGEYQWRHLQLPDVASVLAKSPLPEVRAMAPHPYPHELACICPWMTVNVDCWGNLYACAHRAASEPYSNILRENLYEAMNSIRMLKIRRGLLTGDPIGRCAECRKTNPHGDPMLQRVMHVESTNEGI